MHLSDFDYELPSELVARYPAAERSASRLLVMSGDILDRQFSDLSRFLKPGDLLVLNDTRVIPARLEGRKETGGRVEVLIERVEQPHVATAHIRASKSPRTGTLLELRGGATAEVTGRRRDLFELRFSVPVDELLATHGSMPLPPYLERAAESADSERYQTVYARHETAPSPRLRPASTSTRRRWPGLLTRGLRTRLSPCMLAPVLFSRCARTRSQQIACTRSALLSTSHLSTLWKARVHPAAASSRWEPRRFVHWKPRAASGQLRPYAGETDLFIYPGFEFRVVDILLTNFHLPQSSLLMLVAAFAGRERTLAAYRHAVLQRYRFFSYGDAMLVFPSRS